MTLNDPARPQVCGQPAHLLVPGIRLPTIYIDPIAQGLYTLSAWCQDKPNESNLYECNETDLNTFFDQYHNDPEYILTARFGWKPKAFEPKIKTKTQNPTLTLEDLGL